VNEIVLSVHRLPRFVDCSRRYRITLWIGELTGNASGSYRNPRLAGSSVDSWDRSRRCINTSLLTARISKYTYHVF
jgi:hypothetical protein